MVAVFGIIFAVEIEQKQAIWCLKLLLINLLFFELCKKKTTGLCNHGDLFEKNGILHVMLTYYIKLYKYIHFLRHSKRILTDWITQWKKAVQMHTD